MSKDPLASSLRIPYKALALSSLMVTLAALATLIVVVTVKSVDLLSTVALVLAILAFVVQIIVFLFQNADITRQAAQSRELHAELLSLVTRLEERAQGTQRTVDSINERLIEAIIGKAQREGIDPSSPSFVTRFAEELAPLANERQRADSSGRAAQIPPPANYPGPLERAEAGRIHAEMSRPLSPREASEVAEIFSDLTEPSALALRNFAMDLVSSTRAGAGLGPGLRLRSTILRDRGLVSKIPGWRLYTLSETGRKAGRLFTAGLEPGISNGALEALILAGVERDREFGQDEDNRD